MEQVVANVITAWKLLQIVTRVALHMLNSAKVQKKTRVMVMIARLEDATSLWLTKAHRQARDTSFIAALHATETRTALRLTCEAMPSCTTLMASRARRKSARAKVTPHAAMEWILDEEGTFSLG